MSEYTDALERLRPEFEKRINIAMSHARENPQSHATPMLQDTTNILLEAVAKELEAAELNGRIQELSFVVADKDFLNDLATDVNGRDERQGTRIRLVRLREQLARLTPTTKDTE